MAASGCRRKMGGADAAESMDAKLVEDPTEECEAWDRTSEGNRAARAAGRAIQFADRVRRSQIVDCSLFAELFFQLWRLRPSSAGETPVAYCKERKGHTTNETGQIPRDPFSLQDGRHCLSPPRQTLVGCTNRASTGCSRDPCN
jgi:hypothetical protein